MLVLFIFLCSSYIDALWARQPDIDINRVNLLKHQATYSDHFPAQEIKSEKYQDKRSNDYTNYSSWLSQWNNRIHSQSETSTSPISKTIKINQPREDPRFFYQSDSYLQENSRKNINREVSAVYPGREVVRPNDIYSRPMQLLSRDVSLSRIPSGYNLCVRCPQDRALIAKPGSDRVMLQSPQLYTCSGQKAPREVNFTTVHGPNIGSLLGKGAHMVIGRIFYRGKILQMCKMQIHIIVATCPTPEYLISDCDDKSRLCTFSCRDRNLELHGHKALSCGDNLGWNGWTGNLPVCRERSWCMPPSPPDHGHLSCKGNTVGNGAALSEGSMCRIRCSRGWHWTPRAVTVCRRGKWTHEVFCQSKRPNRTKNPENYLS